MAIGLGLGDILRDIDPETLVLAVLFIVFFVVINFSLSKIFKKDKTSSTILSLCISLLATYGITKTNLNVNNFFYSIGLSEELLYTITPILALIFIVILSIKKDKTTQRRKFSFGRFFMILGGLMVVLGLTPLIYRKAFYIITGAILLAVGGLILKRNKIPILRRR